LYIAGLKTWQEAQVELSAEMWNSGLGGSWWWLWWNWSFCWQHWSGLYCVIALITWSEMSVTAAVVQLNLSLWIV